MTAIVNFVTALPGYLIEHPLVGCAAGVGYALLMGAAAWSLLRMPRP
jgi:hypothetical protein